MKNEIEELAKERGISYYEAATLYAHKGERLTNTPTSKCCEECIIDLAYKETGTRFQCRDKNCPCHTPTTDSKNSSEKCCTATNGLHKSWCTNPTPNPMNTTDKGWDDDWRLIVREFERIDEVCYEGQENCTCTLVEFLNAKILPFIQHIAKEEYSKGYQDGFKQGRFDTMVDAKEEYERGFNQGHAQSAAECKCCDGCKESYERGRKDAVEFIKDADIPVQKSEAFQPLIKIDDLLKVLEAALETPS